MSLKATLKARSAVAKANKGDTQEALKLFEEAVNDGLTDVNSILGYSVMLIRNDECQKARELLVKIQNYNMTPALKNQLFVNYSTCIYKLGEIDKAVGILERQHEKQPSGLVYETLGYLYVEQGNKEKALLFNQEACEYDDEDPICLDNLGQTYYRLLNDKNSAKEWFDKAIEVKSNQIDTLYFLAQYDIEAGDKEAAKEKLEKIDQPRYSPLNYVNKERVIALRASL